MRNYEVMYIVRPDIEQEQLDSEVAKYQGVIENGGGQITHHEVLGKRRLAYEIQKYREGVYVLVNFEAPTQVVQELERMMKISDDVIRYLVVKDPATA